MAGLVLVRQRPGTANGVIFLTLEDETGIPNIIVWRAAYERFRRAVVSGRCLRVTGQLQRESDVVQIIAERIEDISAMLDDLARPEIGLRRIMRKTPRQTAKFLGKNFHLRGAIRQNPARQRCEPTCP